MIIFLMIVSFILGWIVCRMCLIIDEQMENE